MKRRKRDIEKPAEESPDQVTAARSLAQETEDRKKAINSGRPLSMKQRLRAASDLNELEILEKQCRHYTSASNKTRNAWHRIIRIRRRELR